MELENQGARQTYIHLMIVTLQKKVEVLKRLTDLTQQQSEIITNDKFSEDEFLGIITLKDEQLKVLTDLDSGFGSLYESVKEVISKEKNDYVNQITEMQNLIRNITDLSMQLQAMERRNKSKIEVLFAEKRKSLKNARLNNQTVVNYYKAMNNQYDNQSFFYDKKK